jgi:hypothetical protein
MRDIRTRSYVVQEHQGLLWVSRDAEFDLPTRLRALDRRGLFLGQVLVHCDVARAQAWALERDWLRSDALQRHTWRLTALPAGEVELARGPPSSPSIARRLRLRATRGRAYLSGLCMLQIEYEFAGRTAFWLSVFFTPETLTTTRVFLLLNPVGWVPFNWAARLDPTVLRHKFPPIDRRFDAESVLRAAW